MSRVTGTGNIDCSQFSIYASKCKKKRALSVWEWWVGFAVEALKQEKSRDGRHACALGVENVVSDNFFASTNKLLKGGES